MNILFIGGYGSGTDANSVCVQNMARELIARKHHVWLLAMGDDYVERPAFKDDLTIWELPMDYYRRLTARATNSSNHLFRVCFKLISSLRHLLLLTTYPVTSPGRSRRLAAMAKELVINNEIDIVVTIYNPFDNIYAGIKVKEAFTNQVKVVSYHLDLRTASISPYALVRNYIRKHALASLEHECNVVDKILIPYSGKQEIDSVEGIRKDKIRFVGFPMYITNISMEECLLPFEEDTINICYIGSLSLDNRDPRYILTLLEQVSKIMRRRIIVHIWGDIGGLKTVLDDSSVACYHGMIENKYVRYIMVNSDFLLNIGNSIAFDMLPSKVFGMFSTGKPIINVINHIKDATLPFFEQYNNSIDIRECQKSKDDIEILRNGINSKIHSALKNAEGLFDGFKPEIICDEILTNS